ncbi:MAG: sulfurtransferase TusA family protein [Deltaproteobacteria bacterium]|nr:sulfurtransferase TusA family protein [Deltaproteobacteria bacterium]MBW2052524.1 sulfurtransferase TusA family protein [Deltaproteobacteria bacterium]MBW2140397.1 sulfurtransferase TusA family protein [Deltaproteobacteria bacterium]MBW2324469.1 sulfurtransferase TusA family protein [Deltaproteobacteria bacterium]
MSSKVDARGLSCPQPVLMVMDQMKKISRGKIEILVDTDTSKENVSRAAESKGWQVTDVDPEGEGCRIKITKD